MKIFFYIIGIILLIGIIAFIFYRITRKGDSIGFQDFLIDSVFHNEKTPSAKENVIISNAVINGAPPLPKEDPLGSYIPNIIPKTAEPIKTNKIDDALSNTPIPSSIANTGPVVIENPLPTAENIPDWLKVPMNQNVSIHNTEKPETIPTVEIVKDVKMDNILDTTPNASIETDTAIIIEKPVEEPILDPLFTASKESNTIPDWIKNTTLVPDTVQNTAIDTTLAQTNPIVSEPAHPEEEKLPDWLVNSLQSDTNTDI